MNPALQALTSLFQKYCDEYKKLFLPGHNDEAVAESLASFYGKYYSEEILHECVKYYVKTSTEPVLIYNFALESSKIRDHIVQELDSKKQFDSLVQQTRERMERFK
jgi:hypothetical protein